MRQKQIPFEDDNQKARATADAAEQAASDYCGRPVGKPSMLRVFFSRR